MRRIALFAFALVLAARAEDPKDARQEAADALAAKVAKMNEGGAEARKEVSKLSDAFAADYAPDGALAIGSTDGSLLMVVGGKRAKDGVSVVIATAPSGRKVRLHGGAGGTGGKAGRSASWDAGYGSMSGANGAGTGGGRGGSFSAASAGVSVTGSSGPNGKDAEQGTDADFPPEAEMAAIAKGVEAVEAAWDDAAKRQAAIDELAKLRPSRGAVAAFSDDGKLLVLIGASGTDRNPDGVSVEVAGKAAEHVVAIAGDKGTDGKAGAAKVPAGGVAVNGK